MNGNKDLINKLRNSLITKRLQSSSSPSLHLGKFLMGCVKDLEAQRGIPVRTLLSDKLWLVGRCNEWRAYVVHSGCDTCMQTWQEMPTECASFSKSRCVYVCAFRPNCVQVLPRWMQMTQKKCSCLLVVLEECGKDVERQRATPTSVCVLTDIYSPVCAKFTSAAL